MIVHTIASIHGFIMRA